MILTERNTDMPTRYLKPGVRDSEAIDRLSPLAECLFYRLLVTVDDFGRFDARPAMVKAACFPIKESIAGSDCEALLLELDQADLLKLYVADDKPYLQMLKWDNSPRAKESKYPPPAAHVHTVACNPRTVLPETVTETVTDNRNRNKGAAAPFDLPDWIPAAAWLDYVDMRKKIKKPMTVRAMELAINKLAELMRAGNDPTQVLNQSTLNSWQGLFEVKQQRAAAGNETAYQRSMREKVAKASGGLLAPATATTEVVDVPTTTKRLG